MDLFETISTRKTIRKYSKEQLPTEDIKKIINSARIAPSAVNAQNWKFIAVYNQDVKEKMAKAIEEVYEEFKTKTDDENYKNILENFKEYSIFFKNAPVVVACVITEKTSIITENLKKLGLSLEEVLLYHPDSSLLSMGAAIENMILTATSLGYGACWMCAPILAYKELKNILKLGENDRIVTLLPIGKPLDDSTKQPPKKDLDEISEIIL